MNNNIIKALSCLIGSNCLVSTPEAFYIGERGWQSETIRIKALEEKTDMMQVDIEILRSDRDEILGRLSTTENIAINAQALGESNFESIQTIQGILVEVEQRSKNNSSNIDQLIANTDNNTAEIDVIKMTRDEALGRLSTVENNVINLQTQGESNFDSILILQGTQTEIDSKVLKNTTDITENTQKIDVLAESLYNTMQEQERLVSDQHQLTIKVDNLQIASIHTGIKVGDDLTLGKEYEVFINTSSEPQGTIVRFVLPQGGNVYKTTGMVKLDSSGVIGVSGDSAATRYYNKSFVLMEKTVEVGTNIGYFLSLSPEYGEEYKVRDQSGYVIGTITVYANNKGFRTTGWAALSESGSSVVISSGLLKEKYYDSNGTEVTW